MKRTALFITAIILILLPMMSVTAIGADNLRLEGTLVNPDHAGKILTIRTGKSLETKIHFTDKTRFVTPDTMTISPQSLLPGDEIQARLDQRGKAALITVNGHTFAGELLFISPEKLLTAEGRQVYFSPDTGFCINGIKTTQDKIRIGSRVFVRVNPVTNLAGSVYSVDFKNKASKEGKPSGDIWKIETPLQKAFKIKQAFNITVKASGKKKIFLDIPGIAGNIPLKEIKPGLYRGSYKFKRNDSFRTYPVIKLEDKNGLLTRVSPGAIDISVSGPEIIPAYPAPGSTVKGSPAEIFARLTSRGSLIDAAKSSAFIDGRPLQSGLEKNVSFISADLPTLKPGKHEAKVIAEDQAGNRTVKRWQFVVGK